ncbi:hypothetical protein QMK61_04795 [Fulvimonas sp. R45]|uniref:hypothetical protein n=1 Tax=Fulvimonas sp. R45 TaxID=3045937 RepID=UPI00265F4F9B|nr:hypothetical protein [Fulvimonas sp. R45]MDO1528146.1 hypothetical protein [Fulvimonas sp. R45]
MSRELVIILAWTFAIMVLVPKLLRHTELGFSPKGQRFGWWALLLYLQFVMVLLAPILIAIYGVGAFPQSLFVATDGQTFNISLIVLYAVTLFFITLSLSLRVVFSKKVEYGACCGPQDYQASQRFAFAAMVSGMGIMIFGIVFLKFHNALIDVLLTGDDLWTVRRANKYFTDLPSIFQYLITVSGWITAVHAGFAYGKRRYAEGGFYTVCTVLLAGAAGGKGPVLQALIMIALAYAVVRQRGLNPRSVVLFTVLGIPLAFGVLYLLVSLQVPSLTPELFGGYLANRLGVGQMAGTYDGISFYQSLGRRVTGDFWIDIFPLSHSFVPHLSYARKLMMDVEGFAADNTGMKNSFFVSEAFGMGGMTLVVISPVIVGISFAIGIKLIGWILKRLFNARVSSMYFMPIALVSQNVTGDFSQFPLLRGFFTLMVMLVIIAIPYVLFGRIRQTLPRRHAFLSRDEAGTPRSL